MDEKFKDIIHDKMYGFEVEPDASDWSAIEQRLTGLKSGKKQISVKRYISAAAVAALFVISGFAFYFIQKQDNLVVDNQDKKESKSITEPVKTDIKDVDTVANTPFIEPIDDEIILPLKSNNQEKIVVNRGVKENNNSEEKLPNDLPEDKNLIADIDGHIIDNTIKNPADNDVAEGGIKPENEIKDNPDEVKQDDDTYIPLRDNFEEDSFSGNKENAVNEKFSIALSYRGDGGNKNSENHSNTLKHVDALNYGYNYSNADHDFPLSFGLSVRKNLNKRFAVESGLVYTFLRSTINKTQGKSTQKLHYIGIPLSGIFNVKKFGPLSIYLSAGGMVEKNISGELVTKQTSKTIDKKDIRTSKLQWSVNTHLGFNFNIYKGFGLYAEPGWVYNFDDKSLNETYRTKNPSTFNLQIGFRYGF